MATPHIYFRSNPGRRRGRVLASIADEVVSNARLNDRRFMGWGSINDHLSKYYADELDHVTRTIVTDMIVCRLKAAGEYRRIG